MSMYIPDKYKKQVQARSSIRFFLGVLIRVYKYFKFFFVRCIARLKGASIGANSILSLNLALKANKNLVVGEDSIIDTDRIDLRDKVVIGSHCIVNKNVEIIRVSHYIDDNTSFDSRYYGDLIVEDYSWLATGATILPSCCKISKGSVIGACSVLVKNTKEMGVYSGNPATLLKFHNSLHTDRIIVAMQGGDLRYYIKSRKK